MVSEEITQAIKDIALGVKKRYEMKMERISCDRDHIHLLCSAHPKYGSGQLVRLFKSITAREMFNRFPKLKEELWGGEYWTDGYHVSSVCERANRGAVERCIRAQGKKPETA